jgi:membrane protease YdiL (CAAX protease family)
VVFAIVTLEFFRANAGALQQGFATAFHQTPGVWPDLLATSALQCLIFGLFLVAALVATAVEGRRPWRRDRGLGAIAPGLLIGAGGFGAAVVVAAAAGAVGGAPPGSATSPLAPIAFWALIIFVQSLSEEAFFRGWLQPVLSADWGPWAGLVVTSALFALLHVIAGAQSPPAALDLLMKGGAATREGQDTIIQAGLTMTNMFLGGMLFGALAMRTGNLVAPAAAHFAWNWTESGVSGLNGDPTGSLMNLRFIGAPLWNGGADTMNGSLAATLVLLALVSLVLGWRGRAAVAATAAA